MRTRTSDYNPVEFFQTTETPPRGADDTARRKANWIWAKKLTDRKRPPIKARPVPDLAASCPLLYLSSHA